MSEDRSVTDLVARARNGDKRAWDDLVERYAPLVWSICRRHQLCGADADDVHQSVWLQLVSQLDKIRDPAALPGWLATTTRRECGRVLRAARGPHAAGYVLDAETIPDQQAGMADQELLTAERHAALREAFTRLPRCCQQLISMLIQDPPVPYAQISASLNIPVGSIGPCRGRCLDKLRSDPVIAALINAGAASAPVLCLLLWGLMCGGRPGLRSRWNQPGPEPRPVACTHVTAEAGVMGR
jgi:RNA polymerase sigma factor (sigma-70 family)